MNHHSASAAEKEIIIPSRRRARAGLVCALLGVFLRGAVFGGGQTGEAQRETVLDRKTHLEKELCLDIPRVQRLCDVLPLKKRRIPVGDCDLYVEEKGKGLPIVLLHGGPGATHHYFHPHFSAAEDFARVIYYDQRGCGISGYCPGRGYTVDQAVGDLENLRRALKIRKWVVLGHSYGGLLAQCYSLKYAESLAGLVLVGASEGMHLPLKPTRQHDFFSEEEKAGLKQIRAELGELLKQGKLPQHRFVELLVYNNFLNGDWKRQNFYRPTSARLAQIALYEWKQDTGFNDIMSRDSEKIELRGAFEGCPVPTLIVEGKWDLTWNTDKPEALLKNHPEARLVMFDNSSHNPFEDEPRRFFGALREFIETLPRVSAEKLSEWKRHLEEWKRKQRS